MSGIGRIYKQSGSQNWSIDYYDSLGKRHRESTGTPKRKEAEASRKEKIGQGGAGMNMCGHRVTVVVLPRGERFTAGFVSPWESFARNIGAKLAVLADDDQEMVAYYSRMVVNAYRLYQWLKRNPVDVVHSPDFDGLTYYALLAKRQGLACGDMYFAISQFSQREWLREGTGDPYDGMQDLCTDHMERMCIELCDALISANQFGLWRRLANEWRLLKAG